MSKKWVYMFAEGDTSMRNLLGGKGANLSEMVNLGLPVPNGFVVSTEVCAEYNLGGKVLPQAVKDQVAAAVAKLEEESGKKFGSDTNPLLMAVRSGARASMPGMMDTVLNLGLNDKATEAMAKLTNNPRFAYDSYRRFIMMFADVVMGVSKHEFEHAMGEYKASKGVTDDLDLDAEDFKKICQIFKDLYKKQRNDEFPASALEQLYASICAVFESWDNPRAFIYRRMNDIPYEWGTAVNVQSMVFGNMGDNSGSGVVFTRNAANGEDEIYGEFLVNAQGEDVVAGVRTPQPFKELANDKNFPGVYDEFVRIAKKLERHYKDIQDMEMTVENGKLYILQTRNGKRTAQAALKIAVDMVNEGLITRREAIMKVDPRQLDQLLHPNFDEAALKAGKLMGSALPASPGAATGRVYFSAQDAEAAADRGEPVILVRMETSPDDIMGMHVSNGILTVRGGMTSHAAVVARGMGTCCVSGCEEIKLDYVKKEFELAGNTVKEGDFISLDGTTGNIYLGEIKTVDPEISGHFAEFMSWADCVRTMGVRTNADNPQDAKVALDFGAEGIGLTRTEHMFFEPDRIPFMRKMIMSDTEAERRAALDELLPFQKADFAGIYEVMGERPVTIRLLDPPLHEFMPHTEDDYAKVAELTGKTVAALKEKAESLHEFNPMMGHRGCRLAVTYPEIAEMQTRAIIEAALQVKKDKGYEIVPEIMIPLIGVHKELQFVKDACVKVADEIIANSGTKIKYQIGTMIEIPRACIIADDVAKDAEFFSFGTNDLTQMAYGLSRDDAGKLLNDYLENNIYTVDPFARLDQTGVGALMEMAIERGRKTRPDLKIGICGEHGGEPSSVMFCHEIGLDYVSCSPFRVPIARLSAAQVALNQRKED